MTIVAGQIEPLKKLKGILKENGITRFNSIGEINTFLNNFEFEKNEIPRNIENSLDKEINNLQSSLINHQKVYDDLKTDTLNDLNYEIKRLEESSKQAINKSKKNLLNKLIYFLKIKSLSNKKQKLERNLEQIIRKKTRSIEHEVSEIKNKLDNYRENKKNIISTRSAESYKTLTSTKKVVDGLYTTIAGAIGENSTVNELQKLSDNYYLINDYSIKFNPPIHNKKDNDRIFSIQIDHILICQSGVFLLETKNWSKQSINNLDLRSPVEQILRTSYALFVLLNSESNVSLTRHHWGSKKIPIINIIVMTNEKPKEEFKHVKVLPLNTLNGYIEYFDKVLSETEVKSIFNYLNDIEK